MKRVSAARGAISDTQIEELATPLPGADEVLLEVETFAVTANNVTYAAMGDQMKYWDFFPLDMPGGNKDRGVVPVWGHARVIESNAAGIEPGERIYGYLPMASHVIVRPGAVKLGSFADKSPHRAHLAHVYNQYRRLAADPGHDPAREAERSVFEPLFMTGWLIEKMFARTGWHSAQNLIVTSASSKTCLSLVHVARALAPEIRRIGLTSAGNVDFVARTGLYDVVLPYEQIAELPQQRSVVVDFAGNGAVLRAVHETLNDFLAYSCLVGLTHWEDRGGAGMMPGPRPVLFFAPDHVAATIAELGGEGFGRTVAESWAAFVADAAAMVRINEVAGLDAGATAFVALVQGTARADVATVVRV